MLLNIIILKPAHHRFDFLRGPCTLDCEIRVACQSRAQRIASHVLEL